MRYLYSCLFIIIINCVLSAQNEEIKRFNELDSTIFTLLSQGAYQEATTHTSEFVALSKTLPDSINVNIFHLTGLVSFYAGQYPTTEKYWLKVKALYAKLYGTKNLDYAGALNDLAALYYTMGNYELVENLYLECWDILKLHGGESDPNAATMLNNLGLLYQTQEEYEKAEKVFFISKEIRENILGKEHPEYFQSLNNLGLLYTLSGNYKDAEIYLLKALAGREQLHGKSHPEYAVSSTNLASLYRSTGDHKKLYPLLIETLDRWTAIVGKEHPHCAGTLTSLASLAVENKEFEKALDYCFKALDANTKEEVNPQTIYQDLAKKTYYSNERLMESIMVLMDALAGIYHENKDKKTLKNLYELSQSAMQFNKQLRNEFILESSKLNALKDNYHYTQVAMDAAMTFYADEQKLDYLYDAFELAEESKAVILSSTLKGKYAKHIGILPDSLISREQKLQKDLDGLTKAKIEVTSEEHLAIINARTNELMDKIDQFKEQIKSNHPNYYQLKYNSSVATTQDIQKKLAKDALFLEYVIGDEKSYLFAVQKDKVEVLTLDFSKKVLDENIAVLRNLLSNYSVVMDKPQQAYEDYTEVAYWFYEKLLQPIVEKKSEVNQLIIVTDGALGHLPFETFLTSEPSSPELRDYRTLSYLIKDYKISYNYSATLWLENQHNSKVKNNGKVLACAGSYSNNTGEDIPNRSVRLRRLRDGLSDLPAAKEEVKELSRLFEGTFLMDTATNEHFFKENASDYNVIHLAMHGTLSKKYPILSSLVFTENGDSLEDNFLQAYEISHLKLNAQLVTLSACETGYGDFAQGEGVISLARSFMYAGVPSVLVSLWQVNDLSTSKVMKAFYENLAKGLDKAEALQQAKLHYLEISSGIAAHPAFWSPFVQLGDSQAIELTRPNKDFSLVGWIIGLLGGLALLGISMKFLKKKEVA